MSRRHKRYQRASVCRRSDRRTTRSNRLVLMWLPTEFEAGRHSTPDPRKSATGIPTSESPKQVQRRNECPAKKRMPDHFASPPLPDLVRRNRRGPSSSGNQSSGNSTSIANEIRHVAASKLESQRTSRHAGMSLIGHDRHSLPRSPSRGSRKRRLGGSLLFVGPPRRRQNRHGAAALRKRPLRRNPRRHEPCGHVSRIASRSAPSNPPGFGSSVQTEGQIVDPIGGTHRPRSRTRLQTGFCATTFTSARCRGRKVAILPRCRFPQPKRVPTACSKPPRGTARQRRHYFDQHERTAATPTIRSRCATLGVFTSPHGSGGPRLLRAHLGRMNRGGRIASGSFRSIAR